MAHHDGGSSHRADLDRRLDEYRHLLEQQVADLSEDEARAPAVPGLPPILGLFRHTIFVEGVWFDEAVTGRTRHEIGIVTHTANSFKLRRSDTVASVTAEHRARTAQSRTLLAPLELHDTVHGRGHRTVESLLVHVLSELAWRAGQADVLRHVLLAAR